MTPSDIRAARHLLGLTQAELGRLLRYSGPDGARASRISER
jgi:predicted transcriptional regulator